MFDILGVYIGPVRLLLTAGIYSAQTWMKMMIVITQAQLNALTM